MWKAAAQIRGPLWKFGWPVALLMEDGEVWMGRKQVRRAILICVCVRACVHLSGQTGRLMENENRTDQYPGSPEIWGEWEFGSIKEGDPLHASDYKSRSRGHWPAVSREEKSAAWKMRWAGAVWYFVIHRRKWSDSQMMVFSSAGASLGSSVPGNFDSRADQL